MSKHRLKADRVRVTVPASSGNIGVGFDVLGLALDLRNEVFVRLRPKERGLLLRVLGEGEGEAPENESNVIYRSLAAVFKKCRVSVPSLEMNCVNRIPLARGLGSSSAAYLSGLLAGNRLLGDPFSSSQILAWATDLEGHPDNVAPALYGGVRASGVFDGKVLTAPLITPALRLIVAVPDFELRTKTARKVVPKQIQMKDAIWNLASVALLPAAFAGKHEWLKHVLSDRWHEPYRARLIPGFHDVRKAAVKAGAMAVTLSGAGPTMLAFAPAKKVKGVGRAMQAAFASNRVTCRVWELKIDKRGAIVR